MSEKITLFDRFGGTRKMAELLGEAPSTVQSWKGAGRIAASKQPLVLEKGREVGLDISAEDVVFPMGRDDKPDVSDPSATKSDEIICDAQEADSHATPFSGAEVATADSCATFSPTSVPLPSSAASPTSSCSSEMPA